MANVKSASLRSISGTAPAKPSDEVRVRPYLPARHRPGVDETRANRHSWSEPDPSAALITDFIQPSQRTMAWLSDPQLTTTLQAASEALAPDGTAEDVADRYAASVLETHLVARRTLSKLTNAVLKT